MTTPTTPARVEGTLDPLLAALKSYRCQYTVDHDGDALPLVDVLSPGETIAEGERELELLAEHLSLAIEEANDMLSVSGERENRNA